MSFTEQLQDLARRYGLGQHTGLTCISCNSHEKAMSLLVSQFTVKANCHRASCMFKCTSYLQGSDSFIALAAEVRTRVRPYDKPLLPLTEEDLDFFKRRYNVAPYFVCRGEDRYILPIFRPDGRHAGRISRRPYAGSPLYKGEEPRYTALPKVLTYMDTEDAVLSYYGVGRQDYPTVLVEDQISAMRIAQSTDFSAVALLGTGLNDEKVLDLQQAGIRRIWIALDFDATGQAFALARKWGQAFDACRVIIAKHDPKDMSNDELAKTFS